MTSNPCCHMPGDGVISLQKSPTGSPSLSLYRCSNCGVIQGKETQSLNFLQCELFPGWVSGATGITASLSECLSFTGATALASSVQVKCTLGGSRCWLKYLGPWNPPGRTGLSYWLLAFAWPSKISYNYKRNRNKVVGSMISLILSLTVSRKTITLSTLNNFKLHYKNKQRAL